jgi:hypothetical protein
MPRHAAPAAPVALATPVTPVALSAPVARAAHPIASRLIPQLVPSAAARSDLG